MPALVLAMALLVAATPARAQPGDPVDASTGRPGDEAERFETSPPLAAAPSSDAPPAETVAELRAEAAAEGSTQVMVRVEGAEPAVQVALALEGTDHAIGAVVDDVVAVTVTAEGVDRLDAAPPVTAIVEDAELRVQLSESTVRTGADVAHTAGWDGAGRRVVVIDTGVESSHPAFAGAIDTTLEACFLAQALCPNGLGSQTGPGAAAPCTAQDCTHGTHVASITAGRDGGGVSSGVASGATIIPIQIFADVGGEPVSLSSDLLAALDYVLELDANGTPIDAVNLSLSDRYTYPGTCDAAYDGMIPGKVHELRSQGVAVVVASGNEGAADGIGFPACVSQVVPVTATERSADAVWTDANTSAIVALAAPGTDITGATGSSGGAVSSGTSMAAPHVTGAIAVLRQRYGDESVSRLEERLWDTGVAVTDTASGLQLRRIDVAAAVAARDPRPMRPADVLWAVTDRGRVLTAGYARNWGNAVLAPGETIVAGTPTRSGLGYWLASNTGRVLAFGDAVHAGHMAGQHLNAPITAMTTTRSGRGYWLLGADGGIFSFGDARFHGSTGDLRLNAPVTDLARTRTGHGYWLTAEDGGVFTFGDARFHGSTGNLTLNRPVVSIAPGPERGYWLVALDGGVFSFGVPFHGSLPGLGANAGTGYRVRSTAGGRGYYIATIEGGVHRFGVGNDYQPFLGLQAGETVVDLLVAGS